MALKVGILGAGHMGHVHANILSKDERVQIEQNRPFPLWMD